MPINSCGKEFKQKHCFLPKVQKKTIFQNSLFVLKEIDKKKQTQIFTMALPVAWQMEAFEQQ